MPVHLTDFQMKNILILLIFLKDIVEGLLFVML